MNFCQRNHSGLAKLAVLVGLGFFVSACGDEADPPEKTNAAGLSTGSTCPDQPTLTWNNFAMDFFGQYCTRCHSDNTPDGSRHSAPIGYNWDELDSVRAHAHQIDRYAAAGPSAVNTFMPPGDPRPEEEARRQLGEWIACGTPE